MYNRHDAVPCFLSSDDSGIHVLAVRFEVFCGAKRRNSTRFACYLIDTSSLNQSVHMFCSARSLLAHARIFSGSRHQLTHHSIHPFTRQPNHPPGLVLTPKHDQVYATANSFVPQLEQVGVKDSAHCLFTFPNGAVFTLEMTRCSAYGYDNRIEVRYVPSRVGFKHVFISSRVHSGGTRVPT